MGCRPSETDCAYGFASGLVSTGGRRRETPGTPAGPVRDRSLWVSSKMSVDVGGFAVAGVLLVGAIAAQLLAGTANRRSRREETPMRKLYFVVSSIMVVVSNEMIPSLRP